MRCAQAARTVRASRVVTIMGAGDIRHALAMVRALKE
jgi:hypothetical protein